MALCLNVCLNVWLQITEGKRGIRNSVSVEVLPYCIDQSVRVNIPTEYHALLLYRPFDRGLRFRWHQLFTPRMYIEIEPDVGAVSASIRRESVVIGFTGAWKTSGT